MTRIYCFSGTGHSQAVAAYFASRLGLDVLPITADTTGRADVAVVVFPVYCQNVPPPVMDFLHGLDAQYAVLIATYGKISYGNVLYEAAQATTAQIIAGAYVPTGHSFLGQDASFPTQDLEPIFARIASPKQVHIPRSFKNPFASFFPAWRSRIGLQLIKTDACNHCGLCTRSCPMGAIQNGVPDNRCMRCLRCVHVCPQKALRTRAQPVLKAYLKKQRRDRVVIYL